MFIVEIFRISGSMIVSHVTLPCLGFVSGHHASSTHVENEQRGQYDRYGR